MDAKSKAEFINSVAQKGAIPCPNCGTLNKPDNKFCATCGTNLTAKAPAPEKAAFAPAAEEADRTKNAEKYVEPASVFAKGLPPWDIVPPQIMVRRH